MSGRATRLALAALALVAGALALVPAHALTEVPMLAEAVGAGKLPAIDKRMRLPSAKRHAVGNRAKRTSCGSPAGIGRASLRA